MLIFDIETGPLPAEELAALTPPFDPTEVKIGNLKDPAKIAEKIDQARRDHEAEHVERAALSPITGRVLAIGYLNPISNRSLVDDGERDGGEPGLLDRFWSQYTKLRAQQKPLAGFNCRSFDVPFLIRRSWLHEVDVPETVLKTDRYLDETFFDLLIRWRCGNGTNESASLDRVAKFFGLAGKPAGVTGADFARLWATERTRAVEYLQNDLAMTAAIARRMGLV